ncbi:hypothetical protein FHX81_7948 [Saccharothrix saharensis]|uniref:Uncharacterized protein n=1 Tax=Saccharothrix saharensis TaxID=571190 RepID=A0A543JRT6_9PSEU|nr:hypothetical protein [Saccharothrix saharensis]TQM85465.1 hypothetical protein FHX81_7948 [Saccharothrix saharensis]
MSLHEGWTDRTASALQAAMRLTNEAFAEHLGIAVRTVAGWHQKPDLKPKSEMQQLLDTAHDQADPAAMARFAALIAEPKLDLPEGSAADAEFARTPDATSSPTSATTTTTVYI